MQRKPAKQRGKSKTDNDQSTQNGVNQGDLPNIQNTLESGLLPQFAPTFDSNHPLINQQDDKLAIMVKRENFSPNSSFVTLPPYPIVDVISAPDVYPLTAGFLQHYDLLLSLDTEYTLIEDTTRNHILSYQFAALSNDDGIWKYAEDIRYTDGPEVSNRLALADILRVVIKERFRISRRKADNLRVLLVWHFGVAEWAALKDRDSLVSHL